MIDINGIIEKNKEYVGGFNHRYALYVCLPTQI